MPETNQKPPCECGHGPHADVVGDGAAECLETDCACDAYPNPSPPAPAGWPGDEAIARAIYTEGDDFTDDDWALCKRRDAKGVDRAREEAAAVQHLYAPLRERLARFEAALAIDPETVGKIMHQQWAETKRARGFHYPDDCPQAGLVQCFYCHADMVAWEELPEAQKEINRHAFDGLLAHLRRVAQGEEKP